MFFLVALSTYLVCTILLFKCCFSNTLQTFLFLYSVTRREIIWQNKTFCTSLSITFLRITHLFIYLTLVKNPSQNSRKTALVTNSLTSSKFKFSRRNSGNTGSFATLCTSLHNAQRVHNHKQEEEVVFEVFEFVHKNEDL